MKWYWILGIVVAVIVALVVVYIAIMFFKYYIPRILKAIRFKKVFKFKPEIDNQLSKLQLNNVILPEIQYLARELNCVYEKETRHLALINSISNIDFKDNKKEFKNIQYLKKLAENNFFRAVYSANNCGFAVSQDFKKNL